MNCDSYFSIGKTHDVCQDYAKTGHILLPTGELSDSRFAIVSDGCSGSPDTDFGSRFLTIMAQECLNVFGYLKEEWIIWRTKDKLNLPISQKCLDATLLCCYETDEYIRVSCAGDGGIIAKYNNGNVIFFDIDYNGAPGYLSYLLSPENKERYIQEFGGVRTIKSYVNGVLLPNQTTTVCVSDNSFFEEFSFLKQDVEFVMIASDGINSFTELNEKNGCVNVQNTEIVKFLSDIKSYKGEFINRRLKFFLRKECPKLNWSNSDDLAIASISMKG